MANAALTPVRMTTLMQRGGPYVQQNVIGLILADDEIFFAVVGWISIEVVYDSRLGKRLPENTLGYLNMHSLLSVGGIENISALCFVPSLKKGESAPPGPMANDVSRMLTRPEPFSTTLRNWGFCAATAGA